MMKTSCCVCKMPTALCTAAHVEPRSRLEMLEVVLFSLRPPRKKLREKKLELLGKTSAELYVLVQ